MAHYYMQLVPKSFQNIPKDVQLPVKKIAGHMTINKDHRQTHIEGRN